MFGENWPPDISLSAPPRRFRLLADYQSPHRPHRPHLPYQVYQRCQLPALSGPTGPGLSRHMATSLIGRLWIEGKTQRKCCSTASQLQQPLYTLLLSSEMHHESLFHNVLIV
ncbi:hypothetical protein L208DRAFT_655475 [Tricholoma matsutake]|nr:hypothetical protein L208DRAFT_655475 [Tricholoma matsutake 945]